MRYPHFYELDFETSTFSKITVVGVHNI